MENTNHLPQRNKISKLGKMRQNGRCFKQRNKMKSQKNKVETSNLPNKELKVMFRIILKELRRMDKQSEKLCF